MSDAPAIDEIMQLHDEARDRLALSIGRFSIAFAQMERTADHSIWVLLPVENEAIGQLLTGAILNVSTRLDILSSLAHGRGMDQEIRGEINGCVIEISHLNSYRNWLLHGAWGGWQAHNDKWHKRRTKTERKFRAQRKLFSTTEIDGKTAECTALSVKLSKSVKAYERWRNSQPT